MSLLMKKQLKSSAEVVDKHLILSLPNAVEPIVWRMALDKIGTASFEIKHVKASDSYKLILKPKKGTAETIAPFGNKEEALTALLQASNALQSPVGSATSQNASMTNNVIAPSTGASRKWIYLLLSFLGVIALYAYMAKQVPNKTENFGSPNSAASTDGKAQIGVPLSADDFLNSM